MIRNILIIGPSWVGDMIMSQALYRLLKQRDSDVNIDVLAPKWCLGTVERMPEIRRGIAMPIGHGKLQLGMRRRLGHELRQQHYDQAIVLPNSWKSALVPFFAKIPLRTGWRGEMRYGILNDVRTLDKQAYPLMVQRFVALGYGRHETWDKTQYPLPALVVTPESVAETCQALKVNVGANQSVLALAPGAAFGGAKKWPENHYAAVAKHYIAQGWQVWLMGSPADQETLERIQALCSSDVCHIFSEQADLNAKIDLLSLATALVSNDSGLLHIGAALNRPTVGIYGSTSPDFTPPLGEHVAIVQQDDLACRPCFKRACPLTGDAQLRCLRDITPERVIAEIEGLC